MYLLNIDIANEQNNEIYPQALHMGLDYDFEATNSVTRINSNEPLSFSPNLKSFHLDPETNLTDIISQGYVYTLGLLVSEALHGAIKNYALQPHRAYMAEVVNRNTSYQYRWLHVMEKIEPFLDLARSEFLEKNIEGVVTAVKFSNIDELKANCKSIVQTVSGTLTAHRLHFLANTPSYDLFFLDLVPRLVYISYALRDVLLNKRFTGFEITPAATDICFG